MPKDPVCGMHVEKPTPYTHDFQGKRFHFCSSHCVEKFSHNPEQYLNDSEIEQPSKNMYTCPMHPEIIQDHPGSCPKCGMSLEALIPVVEVETKAESAKEYTCPMHPEIIRDRPGSCPKCGMALEAKIADDEEEDEELISMSRRFWLSLVLSIPLVFITMGELFIDSPLFHFSWRSYLELFLATPVVLWAGLPFFQRGWASVVNRSLNMFTLIALGTGVAYLYSFVATIFPTVFPEAFRSPEGAVADYFEACIIYTTDAADDLL